MNRLNKSIKRSLRSLLFLLAGLCGIEAFAQRMELVNEPQKFEPYIITITNGDLMDETKDYLGSYSGKRNPAFLLIDAESSSHNTLIQSINSNLNENASIDKHRVYLLIVGDQSFFEKYSSLGSNLIFSSKYYLSTDGTRVDHDEFEIGKIHVNTAEEVVSTLTSKYLWEIRLREIKQSSVSDINENKVEKGISIRLAGNFLSAPEFEPGKRNFRSISVGTYRRWNKHWQTSFDLSIGYNFPSRRKIQREAQALIGDSFATGKEVDLDMSIHIYTNVNFELKYLFRQNERLNPYLGVGLGATFFLAMDTTISVDASEISSGSRNFTRPDGFNRNNLESISGRSLSFSSGFLYQMGELTKIDVGARWNNDLNMFKSEGDVLNGLNLHFGINIKLQKKKDLFYEYVKR